MRNLPQFSLASAHYSLLVGFQLQSPTTTVLFNSFSRTRLTNTSSSYVPVFAPCLSTKLESAYISKVRPTDLLVSMPKVATN